MTVMAEATKREIVFHSTNIEPTSTNDAFIEDNSPTRLSDDKVTWCLNNGWGTMWWNWQQNHGPRLYEFVTAGIPIISIITYKYSGDTGTKMLKTFMVKYHPEHTPVPEFFVSDKEFDKETEENLAFMLHQLNEIGQDWIIDITDNVEACPMLVNQ